MPLAGLIHEQDIRGMKAISTIPICEPTLIEIDGVFQIELKPERRKKTV